MTATIDPLEVQFHQVHDCIRACVYADYIARKCPKKDAWISIGDICYSEAIMSWNSIFGTDSQASHWKGLVAKIPLPARSPLKPFGKTMIAEYLRTTEPVWEQYHASLVNFRNARLAHFNHNIVREDIPNLTWAMRSACLYREWLLSLLRAHQAGGTDVKVTETSGETCWQCSGRRSRKSANNARQSNGPAQEAAQAGYFYS